MYKCLNCGHESEAVSIKPLFGKCIVCGDEVKQTGKQEVSLDLNNDGKVDNEDSKIASKVMNTVKRKKRSKKK